MYDLISGIPRWDLLLFLYLINARHDFVYNNMVIYITFITVSQCLLNETLEIVFYISLHSLFQNISRGWWSELCELVYFLYAINVNKYVGCLDMASDSVYGIVQVNV